MSRKTKSVKPVETEVNIETELQAQLVEANRITEQAFSELGVAYLEHADLAKKFAQATERLSACEEAARDLDQHKMQMLQDLAMVLGPDKGQWTLDLEKGKLVKTGGSNG